MSNGIKNKYMTAVAIVFCAVLLVFCAFSAAGMRNTHVFRTQTVEGVSGGTFTAREERYHRLTFYADGGIAAAEGISADEEVPDGEKTLTVRVTDKDGNTVWERGYPDTLGTDGMTDPMEGERIPVEEQILLDAGNEYTLTVMRGDTATRGVTCVLYGSEGTLVPVFACIALLLLAAAVTGCYFIRKGGRNALTAAVTAVILLEGIAFQFAFKPPSVPDEPSHFMTAANIACRLTGGGSAVEGTESGILRQDLTGEIAQNLYQFLNEPDYGNIRIPSAAPEYLPVNTPVQYEYVPPALMIALLKAVHAPYQVIFIGGRLFNLLIFLVVILLAMRTSEAGRHAIAGIAVMPSVVRIAASYSYDMWNLAFFLLFIAYCLRLTERKEVIGVRQVIILAILFALFAPVKYIYVVAGLAVFFFTREQWKDRRVIYGCAALVLVIFAGVLLTRGQEVFSYLFSGNMDPRGMRGDAGSYSIGWIMAHPFETLLTFAHTVFTLTGDYFHQLIAGEFYEIHDAKSLLALYGVLLTAFGVLAVPDGICTRRVRAVSGLIFVLGVFAVFASLLFTFSTRPDAELPDAIGFINGIQGRYFAPLLIFITPLLNRPRLVKGLTDRGLTKELLLGAMILSGAAVIFVRATTRLWFY